MDLRTDYPYSLLRKGIIKSYPSLQSNLHCDVAVIGAGITGALVAWHLCNAGLDVAVFDKRHVGMGSTAASTSLLQYEIDVPLSELITRVGDRNAVKSYLLCLQAIHQLEEIARRVGEDSFNARPSFQYASYKKDVNALRVEYQVRKNAGIDLQWLDAKEVKDNFGFKKAAGILSANGAEIDAYSLTHSLLNACIKKGVRVFDHTKIERIVRHKKSVDLVTNAGKKIYSKKIIIACGYESGSYLPKHVEKFYSTYAIVSEPFSKETRWYKNALIWETARPYLYMRCTTDNRILVGGKDADFINSTKRDAALHKKALSLQKSFNKLFPGIPFQIDFEWAGTFASTKDGLPYIGKLAAKPHTYFALGYGGNGITFSLIAARIITDMISGKKNKDAAIFGFDR